MHVYLLTSLWLSAAAITGLAVPVSVACAVTAGEATFGSFPAVSLLVVCCGVFAAAAFGLLVGSVVTPLVAGPVALVVVYAIPLVADSGRAGLAPLAGLMIADDRERTYFHTATEILAIRGLWVLALAAVFLALAARTSNGWLVPTSFACLLSVPLLLAGQGAMQPIPGASDEVCTTDRESVTVCMTRARAHAEGGIRDAIDPALAVLRPLGQDGLELREELLPGSLTAEIVEDVLIVPFAPTNGVSGEAHRVGEDDMVVTVLNRVLRDNCNAALPSESSGRSPGTASDVILETALTDAGVSMDGRGPIDTPLLTEDFIDWSDVSEFRADWKDASSASRNAWLKDHRSHVVRCDLAPGDLQP